MAAIGFINTFDELAGGDLRLGRKVANQGLAAALLEHSSADELHFFLPFHAATEPFTRAYALWLEGAAGRRVKLLPALKLSAALAQGDYQALYAAELDRYLPELCHLASRYARQPIPVTCATHTLSYWATQVRGLYKLLPGARPWDAVFCTSRAARDHLAAAWGEAARRLEAAGLPGAGFAGRLEVVPLGVRSEEFSGHDQAQARAELGLEQERPVILCLGRLDPRDKYDLMPVLAALSGLARERDFLLAVAGADERGYGPQLQEAAQGLGLDGRLRLFPDFPSAHKPLLLAAADVFLSPADNLQETFGLSLLEAMAAGLPVVASDFSGYRDLVEHGVTGFLIPTLGPADYGLLNAAWPVAAERTMAEQAAQRTALDLAALRQALETLLDSPELRREMGAAGRQRVRSRFDWAVVVRRMEELWAELAHEARTSPPPPLPPDPLGAGLGVAFGHFCSRPISPEDVLAPGPMATAFAQGGWARHPSGDVADLLPPAGLEMILAALEELGGRADLGRITAALEGRLPAQMCQHLALYGLKQGVLALA